MKRVGLKLSGASARLHHRGCSAAVKPLTRLAHQNGVTARTRIGIAGATILRLNHLGDGHNLPALLDLNLAGAGRIELPYLDLEASVLPLNDAPAVGLQQNCTNCWSVLVEAAWGV